jgi:hypothetical protein
MPKYWYKVVIDELSDSSLQRYGDEGWELVGSSPSTAVAGQPRQFVFIFKKPKIA